MRINNIKSLEAMNEAVEKITRFSEAVRLKCLDCCYYQLSEVAKCPTKTCPLWKFRNGRRPPELRAKRSNN